jgi:hypothetical protein
MDTGSLEYNVIVVKWGDKFTAEHVNRLYRMAKRNITLPFNFYCYTEDATDVYDEVNIIPLDESLDLEKWWWKLTLFKENSLNGINLFLDLDVVIQNNIDHLFNVAMHDKLVLISPNYDNVENNTIEYDQHTFPYYNSSIMIWYNNEMQLIYDKFHKDINLYKNVYYGIDRFMSYEIDQAYFIPLNQNEYYYRSSMYNYDNIDEFETMSLRVKNKTNSGSKSIKLLYNPNRAICVFNQCHQDYFYQGMEKYWL